MKRNSTKRRAVFLDRDGTINQEVNYLKNIKDLKILPNSARAIREFNQLDYLVIVVTNQSAISRGYLNTNELDRIHQEMKKQLEKQGATIDDIFICPHHPDDNCNCRKPKTGLIEQAKKKYNIDLNQSFVVGDKMADILLGQNAGCQSILVRTGYGKNFEDLIDRKKDLIANDLLDVVGIINNI